MQAVVGSMLKKSSELGRNLHDIQGNVLRGYRLPKAIYLFFDFPGPEEGRAFVQGIAGHPRLTTAAIWEADAATGERSKPEVTLNFAISYRGLEALGIPQRRLSKFPEAFRLGMSARAAELGDTEESAPSNWEPGLSDASISAIAIIQTKKDGAPNDLADAVRGLANDAGISEAARPLEANALPGAKEHFGFRDGIGQPSIEGSPFDDKPGMGTPSTNNTWKPVKAGEFILGYEKESAALEIPAEIRELCLNGTYMVFRKLEQNVGAFRQFLKQAALSAFGSDAPDDQELIGAKLVGRWRSGTPVALSPNRDVPTPAPINDFRYNDDPNGEKCPLGAHIRRCNPRDALDGGDIDVRLHRLLRRGMPYGPRFDDRPDVEERGVAFFGLNADIERQFEFVQQDWVNKGEFAGLHEDERDPIVGANASGQFTVPGASILPVVFGLNRFVITRGGGYFLEPGIAALDELAREQH